MKKLIIIIAFLFVSYGHSDPYLVKESCKFMENYLQEIFNDIILDGLENNDKDLFKKADKNYKLAIIYQAVCKN